ncbi:DUF58 domain-containing protein [Xylanimonas allomyrinae]|uniref:DUF58 domain-containing protein n=1 Tax=Xylanimonas allomyrinae TaxID=2509459 RepID=A0A4P6EIB2_9MICO|nr:DUF58 domain-containing protein [Xylanimonas allomyrinae]QAY62164.1 DUF58 domain-containing protein [Xylanimonas allomyrinae]
MSFQTESRFTRTATRTGTVTRTVVSSGSGGRVVTLTVRVAAAARALRAWAVRAFAAVRRSVTPAGWLVLCVAAAGSTGGLVWGWTEWVVAGLAAGVVLLLAVPFLLGSADVDVTLELSQDRVVVGDAASADVRVVNDGHRLVLPTRLEVPIGNGLAEVPVPLLLPGRSLVRPLVVPAERRGVVVVGPVTAVRSDPVGVLRRETAWPGRHEVFVRPRTVTVPSTSMGLVRDLEGAPTRRLVDADVSFHALREYAPGDSWRQVHWKSTAKTGQLMVRQYEESMRSRIAVVLSCARGEYRDDEEFELAVSAATSMAVQGIRDGRDVDAVVSAEIPELVRSRVRAIDTLPTVAPRALLDAVCRVELAASTMPIEEVCRLAAESSERMSLAVVVCGSEVGLRRLRRAALTFPGDAAVLGVVCDPRSHPVMRQLGTLTVLTVGVLEDLRQLLSREVSS